MQIRLILSLSVVLLGLGSAHGAAWAAANAAAGAVPAPSPGAAALPVVGKTVPTETCAFSTGQTTVVCEEGCHAGLNDSICTDMEKLFRACISMKCSHVKGDDPDSVTKLMRCQAWAGGVCARVMGCNFSDESGREAQ